MTVTINGTTGIVGPNGTASAPAMTGTDTDTGIVYGTNTVQVATGGTTAVTVDSSQNVGVGTTSPIAKLDVRGILAVANSGASYWAFDRNDSDGALTFADGTTERMRIDTSGRLLLNTTTQFTTGGFTPLVTINTAADGIAMPNMGNGYIGYITRASAAHGYYAGFFLNSSNTGVGNINCSTTATSYNTTSDYRLKENITPMTGALAKVSALKPVTYTWKSTGEASQGFIAHELAEVVPDCVTGEKDAVDEDGNPKYQGIDTSFLVATLTAAIQELKTELDTVKTELATLKGTV